MSSHESGQYPAELTEELDRLKASMNCLMEADTIEHVPEDSVQRLMAAAVRLYVSKLDTGTRFLPLPQDDDTVTVTDVATTVVEMLQAVDMEVFELGMWKTWGTR